MVIRKVRIQFLVLFSLFSISLNLLANTHLFIRNNTSSNIQFEAKPEQIDLDSRYWNLINSQLGSVEKKEVLNFSRNAGVKRGETYYLKTKIKVGDNSFNLNFKLVGTIFSSDGFYESLDKKEFVPFATKDRVEKIATTIIHNDKKVNLLIRFIESSDFNDIEVILNEEIINVPTKDNEINILSYNVYMRPNFIFHDHQLSRAYRLPDYLKGYDVLVLSEMFIDSSMKIMSEKLKEEYPYHSKKLGSDTVFKQDSGVIIFSKWPIVNEDGILFSICSKSDCFAQKGARYVRIKKGEKFYNIIGTHTQAFENEAAYMVRRIQFLEMNDFVNYLNIDKNEPVLYAGDFNVDKINNMAEYSDMLNWLDADPAERTFGIPYTFDINTNALAIDVQSGFLDYVMTKKDHLQPKKSFNRVVLLKSASPWKIQDKFAKQDKGYVDPQLYWDLSDHYPVQGFFAF